MGQMSVVATAGNLVLPFSFLPYTDEHVMFHSVNLSLVELVGIMFGFLEC